MILIAHRRQPWGKVPITRKCQPQRGVILLAPCRGVITLGNHKNIIRSRIRMQRFCTDQYRGFECVVDSNHVPMAYADGLLI